MKTRDLAPTGSFHLLALGAGPGGRQLTFHEGGLEPTQDWKRIEVVFNSLDQREANLYVGFWGEGKGTIWIDDLALEELALVNVLRRAGCPLTVKSADGRTTYEEGRDFEPVVDPKLGRVPWEGEFEFDHAGRGDQDHAAFADQERRPAPRELVSPGDHARLSGDVLPERAQAREDPRRSGPAASMSCSTPRRFSCRTTRSAWPTGAWPARTAS